MTSRLSLLAIAFVLVTATCASAMPKYPAGCGDPIVVETTPNIEGSRAAYLYAMRFNGFRNPTLMACGSGPAYVSTTCLTPCTVADPCDPCATKVKMMRKRVLIPAYRVVAPVIMTRKCPPPCPNPCPVVNPCPKPNPCPVVNPCNPCKVKRCPPVVNPCPKPNPCNPCKVRRCPPMVKPCPPVVTCPTTPVIMTRRAVRHQVTYTTQ